MLRRKAPLETHQTLGAAQVYMSPWYSDEQGYLNSGNFTWAWAQFEVMVELDHGFEYLSFGFEYLSFGFKYLHPICTLGIQVAGAVPQW